jgi:hypothetical protein
MDKQTIRYKKDVPNDDLPKVPEPPTLRVCQFADGKLSIPSDIRKHFLTCPIYGPEWREILKQFDQDWGAPAAAPTPSPTPDPSGGGSPVKAEGIKTEFKVEPVTWSTKFTGSPTTLTALKAKFGADLTEMVGISSTTSFFLAPGPELYLMAKEATQIKAWEAAVVTHGAGSWLTGEKAVKYVTNNPDRGIPCKLEDDEFPAIFED